MTAMKPQVFDAFEKMLEYIEDEEGRHFRENCEPEDHIYHSVQIVSRWFDANVERKW